MDNFNEFDQQGKVPARSTGDIISHAFDTYKGVVLYAIAAMVLYYIVSTILQMLIGFNSMAMIEMIKENPGAQIDYLAIPGVKTYSGLSFLLLMLSTPLFVGLIYISHKSNTKQTISFADLFYAYKNNFVSILIYAVISNIILAIGFTLCFLPVFFILPFFLIGYPIILFENASATEALSKSFNIAKENYGTFIGVAVLSVLIGFAGVILCGIGVLATAPFYLTAAYSAYITFVGLPKQITYK